MSNRVLQIVTGLSGGGVGSVIMNYYRHMDDSYIFDFVVNEKTNGFLEREIEEKGGYIYEVPPLRYGKRNYFSSLIKVIKLNRDSILHCNMGEKSFFFLFFAWLFGIKRRIVHIHSSVRPEGKVERIIRIILTKLCVLFATDYFSCGEEAAEWFYGKSIKDPVVLRNAIDISAYSFNDELRQNYREKLAIQDKFVIGNVGRLSYPKNHTFMLKVFSEYLKICPNAVLVLAGAGELEREIREEINQLGIIDNVMMLGLCDYVTELLNAFDLFILPSRSEGVPVAAVEAMANGLPLVCSSAVTKEINVGQNIKYISLELPPNEWAKQIDSMSHERYSITDSLVHGGYSIQHEANKLTSLYSLK